MKKSIIYTCTGDAGTTSLVGGKRVKKNNIRLEAYGTVDELNSYVGLLASAQDIPDDTASLLGFIQNKLFNIGAYLATDNPDGNAELKGLTQADTRRLETAIDTIDAQLPQLNNFVLPGGSRESALAHVCRTVCRRCERCIINLSETVAVDTEVMRFVNRLSDFFFVLARYNNIRNSIEEIFWNKDCQL